MVSGRKIPVSALLLAVGYLVFFIIVVGGGLWVLIALLESRR